MFMALIIFLLYALSILCLSSVIPLIYWLLIKLKANKQHKIIYRFSNELVEHEYSDTMWKEYHEKYEKSKVEEYRKQLP